MCYCTGIPGIGVTLGFGIINVKWQKAGGKCTRDPQHAGTLPAASEDSAS